MNCPTNKNIHILHTHTVFSVLDGVSKVDDFIKYAVANNLGACGCTDHGFVMGLYDLVSKCGKAKIKPVPGLEAYLMPTEDYKFVGQPFDYFHLTIWAINEVGYKNLISISNKSWDEGRVIKRFGMPKPRITFDDLFYRSEGLVVASGCIEGPICKPYLRGETEMSLRYAEMLLSVFGDRFFFEILPHRVDKNYEPKVRVCEVEGVDGIVYRFAETDIIQTDRGEMTALRAAELGVTEIWSPKPERNQDGTITLPGETNSGVFEEFPQSVMIPQEEPEMDFGS